MIDRTEEAERAVSPVVGVAILVGITVILASVVGAFVFGLVSIGESSPNASFTFSQETSNFTAPATSPQIGSDSAMTTVRVTHNSGQAINYNELRASVSGNKSDPQSNQSVYEIDYNGDLQDDDWHLVLNDTSNNKILKTGDSFNVDFYGIAKSTIQGEVINDYNVTDSNPPTDQIGFTALAQPRGQKLGPCDNIEIIWRSQSGASGQVLQSYILPGTEC